MASGDIASIDLLTGVMTATELQLPFALTRTIPAGSLYAGGQLLTGVVS